MNADGTSQRPIDTSTAHDINPDWQPITLAVNDVRVKEKNTNAVFTVRLSANSEETITVNYATADGSAKTPADYTAQSGTLTFEPGQTTQQIAIPIRSDRRNEANEKFFVNLSSATNATIFDAQGRASIVDND
jgi:large repetitive protein